MRVCELVFGLHLALTFPPLVLDPHLERLVDIPCSFQVLIAGYFGMPVQA